MSVVCTQDKISKKDPSKNRRKYQPKCKGRCCEMCLAEKYGLTWSELMCQDIKTFRCPKCYEESNESIPIKPQTRFWHSDPGDNSHNRGCWLDPKGKKKAGYSFTGVTLPAKFMTDEEKELKNAAEKAKKRRRRDEEATGSTTTNTQIVPPKRLRSGMNL